MLCSYRKLCHQLETFRTKTLKCIASHAEFSMCKCGDVAKTVIIATYIYMSHKHISKH